MNDHNSGDWKEWSQHVLFEIKRINDGQIQMGKDIGSVGKDIGNINITLASQHVQLTDHIRRTELLEDAFREADAKLDTHKKDVEAVIKPLHEHVIEHKSTKSAMITWIGIVVAIGGAIASYLAGK